MSEENKSDLNVADAPNMEVWFMFKPEDNITAQEMAVVFSALNIGIRQNIFDRIPENVRRHFKVKE